MRHVLSLLLVLTACSAASADPAVLFKDWRFAVQKHKSVRFDVAITVEGKDPRKKTYVGVQHVSGGGGTTQEDVTAHVESRYRTVDYRSITVGGINYLQHSDLTMPQGKTFCSMEDLNAAPWVGVHAVDLSMATRDYHPGNLFSGIDSKTVRLVEHEDDRYVFTAGGVPHSGGYVNGQVRLVVEEDDEGRVVRVEQTAPSADKQQENVVAVYSQWGTAPDVLRPAAPIVAKPSEVVVKVGA